jgi:hypothetical protein
MTRTSQLDAHYAVIQVDSVARNVVMSFQLTVDLLVAEVQERAPGEAGRRRLRELLTRYRANVLEVADTLVALRGQCGTDADDLPDADDDVAHELARIRAAHERAELAKPQPAPADVPCQTAFAVAAREGGAL